MADAGDVAAPPTTTSTSRTLLPAPLARVVSVATRSTSFAIRLGSLASIYGLDAARVTTLSSLELARALVERVLSRAARDALPRAGPRSDLAAADAETILERSLENLHYAVTQVVFWTAASFRLTGSTISAASDVSRLMLSSLDQLFGSTDSSRAMASIITLIRREFNNPATGVCGEKVGVLDLVLGLSALAYLQRACRRSPAEERRRLAYEEVIWDVVVLNDGERVDVEGRPSDDADHVSEPLDDSPSAATDDEAVLARLKSQIVASLPAGTTVSISNAVSSVQTITVDVEGQSLSTLPTPPGAQIVETRGLGLTSSGGHRPATPRGQGRDSVFRVVYRIERDKLRTTAIRSDEEPSGRAVVAIIDDPPAALAGHGKAPMSGPGPRDQSLAFTNTSPALPAGMTAFEAASPGWESSSSSSSSTVGALVGGDVAPERRQTLDAQPPGKAPLSETTANQKKQRLPLGVPLTRDAADKSRPGLHTSKRLLSKRRSESVISKPGDKRGGLKQVLKGGGQSLSSMWNREPSPTDRSRPSFGKPRPQWKAPSSSGNSPVDAKAKPWPRNQRQGQSPSQSQSQSHSQPHSQSQTPSQSQSQSGSQSQSQSQSRRGSLAARRALQTPEPLPRCSSQASLVSIHERCRDSVKSQAGSYTVRANGELRPASPTIVRTDYSTQESTLRPPRADLFSVPSVPPSPHKGTSHRRSTSYAPSLYSLATNDSQSSLILSSYYQKSAYNASDALATLRREGFVDGTFPAGHLLPSIARYMRFSSACYGSHFLKFMGISTEMPALGVWDGTHNDVRHFVHHTRSCADNILLASFVDPQGGADATGSTGTGVPLVHYISLDHEAKAVVLACRGTLGFEDVMADMTCEYDDMAWRGRRYKVHKGIHASARRLLYGDDGRVLVTIRKALVEFPDYGLVLCGHSLGGGVTSLLGVMLSQPNPDGPGFVISVEPHLRLLQPAPGTAVVEGRRPSDIRLPSGRRIHVYAYGPPGVMSAPLRKITRGLVTTVVHGNDIVPHLSLGLLHDFQALALAFKQDENRTKADIRARMWYTLRAVYQTTTPLDTTTPGEADEQWIVPALDALRENFQSARLLPPGEVFAIESQSVLRRDAFMLPDEGSLGRPARRVVLKYIRDVEGRFSEVRFGTRMLTDHSPAKYEDALNKLRLGVVE
ncbi:hypothetical protein RJ55_03421 [Drechmeria coniospora]|nr:hypothetical protein RJ55_03421 [Drechmeria coniospora]